MNKTDLGYILDLLYNRKQNDINDLEQQMITRLLAKIRLMLGE